MQLQLQAKHGAPLTAILERLELPPFRTQSGLCDFVGQVGLVFSRDVHHVEREHCERQRRRESRRFGGVRGRRTFAAPGRSGETLTVAWYPRKSNVHVNDELLPPRPVNLNGRLEVNTSIVDEFEHHRREDDREGDESH